MISDEMLDCFQTAFYLLLNKRENLILHEESPWALFHAPLLIYLYWKKWFNLLFWIGSCLPVGDGRL